MARPKFTFDQIEEMQARLVEYLGDGDFHLIRNITKATGITRDHIRMMPIFAEGAVLALPQNGFRLTKFADAETITHVINSMRSRAREINTRADAIEDSLLLG